MESREYNGRWYTDVKPWKLEIAGQGTNPVIEEKPGPENTDLPWDNELNNDLPF